MHRTVHHGQEVKEARAQSGSSQGIPCWGTENNECVFVLNFLLPCIQSRIPTFGSCLIFYYMGHTTVINLIKMTLHRHIQRLDFIELITHAWFLKITL